MINEVISKNADAKTWIHDFVQSDNPKFEGKSKIATKEKRMRYLKITFLLRLWLTVSFFYNHIR
jgi:hypothetical protein